MLYPFKFDNVYKDYLWGGRTLSILGKKLPDEGIVAESWEISAHPNGMSVISNGDLKGKTLNYILQEYASDLLGEYFDQQESYKFPLLIKLIDACDDLSVQVHPNDKQASILENGEYGKNEMWYIVSAKPGSKLIIGTKPGVTRESFTQAVADGTLNECMNYVNVQEGDIINIPAGLLHAIGKGLLICEIQQNSDTTYRVYDYDRKDQSGQSRPLHIEKALDVIDFNFGENVLKSGAKIYEEKGNIIELLALNKYFKVEKWKVKTSIDSDDLIKRFNTITVIAGQGMLFWQQSEHTHEIEIKQGESVLIPACINKWKIAGNLNLLTATTPDFSDFGKNADKYLSFNPGLPKPAEISVRKAFEILSPSVAITPLPDID